MAATGVRERRRSKASGRTVVNHGGGADETDEAKEGDNGFGKRDEDGRPS
jgi:hypothetical protein